MTFQSIVMTISTIILIIALCLIGLSLYRQKYKSDYPPVIANCPDYWIDKSDSGNGSKCNIPNFSETDREKYLGIQSQCMPKDDNGVDFSIPYYSGADGLCNKAKWAKSCNLTWDGVSDNPDVCGN